jgi:hypothetical protein
MQLTRGLCCAGVSSRSDCCVFANGVHAMQEFACEPGPSFITIRSSFHTPRAKAAPMNLRTPDMQALRSTTVDGVLRMRFEILGGLLGLRLTAGAQR